MKQGHEQPIEIRSADPGDAGALAQLLGDLGYPADPLKLPDRLTRMADAGASTAMVAVIDGQLVGLATVHGRIVLHSEAPVAQLTALVVPREMRGRGIGRALVAESERWAARFGARRLVVTTALHRAEAPVFYERLGFEHTGRRYVKTLE
ncbi:MAG: GNAT family N-acetyltransferase [Gemmatimonadaceae bacterium]